MTLMASDFGRVLYLTKPDLAELPLLSTVPLFVAYSRLRTSKTEPPFPTIAQYLPTIRALRLAAAAGPSCSVNDPQCART